MKTYIKNAIAVVGFGALAYGTIVAIAAVSAWDFSTAGGAILSSILGVIALMIGDAWDW